MPNRWVLLGFLASGVLLFAIQVLWNVFSGFAGTSIEESLLLFNGSYVSYVMFNVQVTYRAFAVPLLALAVPFIFRLSR